jgi:hypothetical protein
VKPTYQDLGPEMYNPDLRATTDAFPSASSGAYKRPTNRETDSSDFLGNDSQPQAPWKQFGPMKSGRFAHFYHRVVHRML